MFFLQMITVYRNFGRMLKVIDCSNLTTLVLMIQIKSYLG